MGMINVFRRMLAISGLPLSLFTAQPAASHYPDRPVSLILPTPPGDAADLNARPLAKQKDAEATVSLTRKIAKVQ